MDAQDQAHQNGAEREGLQVCRDTDNARSWPSHEDGAGCEGEEGHFLPLHPCCPDRLYRGAQQRPTALRGAEPTQAPTPGTPKPACIPLDSRPTKGPLFGSGRRRRARIAQRRRSFIDVSMATTFPYPPFF